VGYLNKYLPSTEVFHFLTELLRLSNEYFIFSIFNKFPIYITYWIIFYRLLFYQFC